MDFVAVLRVDMTPLPPFANQYSTRVALVGTGKLYAGSTALAVLSDGGDVGSLVEGIDFLAVSDFNMSRRYQPGRDDQADPVFDAVCGLQAGDVVKLRLQMSFWITEKRRKAPQFDIVAVEAVPRAQAVNRR